MRLAEGVTTGGERDGFLIIHRHPRESLADVAARTDRIGLAVGAFGIDVNEAHLHRAERVGEVALARIALIVEPLALGSPVNILFGFPHIGAATGKPESLEAHRFECDIAREDQQIGPAQLAAIFLLDRPQQAARLVEIAVIGPAVERRETLRARARPTAPVGNAIGTGAMPRHADEERAVMAIVRRPPRLRIGHQRVQISDDGVEIERLEFLGIVEFGTHRVRLRRMLVQHTEMKLVRPPIAVRHAPNLGAVGAFVRHGARGFGVHRLSNHGWGLRANRAATLPPP